MVRFDPNPKNIVMPVIFIEGPGISPAAKRKLARRIHAAVKDASSIGETLIFFREHPSGNFALNGELQGEPRSARAPSPAVIPS